MEQEKAKYNAVKMVRDRLYINGKLGGSGEATASALMECKRTVP